MIVNTTQAEIEVAQVEINVQPPTWWLAVMSKKLKVVSNSFDCYELSGMLSLEREIIYQGNDAGGSEAYEIVSQYYCEANRAGFVERGPYAGPYQKDVTYTFLMPPCMTADYKEYQKWDTPFPMDTTPISGDYLAELKARVVGSAAAAAALDVMTKHHNLGNCECFQG